MSFSKSLPQLEQAFRLLEQNVGKAVTVMQEAETSVAALQESVQRVVQTALTDDKTPLESNLAWEQTLTATEDERSVEVVVFGDLNRFKNLNSDYGHDAGDYAIQHVGTMIQDLVVEGLRARAFRKSGDEFIILLKHEVLDDFISMSEERFGRMTFDFADQRIRTAMSFGYAIHESEIELGELLKRADLACRKAKRLGDGRCAQWTKEMSEHLLVEKRAECPKCETLIDCAIPSQSSVLELRLCPVCSASLLENPTS